MWLKLDGTGPAFRQIYRALRTSIVSGELAAGTRLPPTRTLAEQLALSRTTVLQAYEQLAAEGYIVGRTGSGSYVSAEAKPPAKRRAAALGSVGPSVAVERCRQHRRRCGGIATAARALRLLVRHGEAVDRAGLVSTLDTNRAAVLRSRELVLAAIATTPCFRSVCGIAYPIGLLLSADR